MTATRNRRLIALAVLGLAFLAGALAITLSTDRVAERGLWAGVGGLLGASFIATGLFASWRRPDNRTGALMAAVGFTWLASSVYFTNSPSLFLLGLLSGSLPLAIVAHLMLAFPRGRLETRYERVLIVTAYLCATVVQWPGLLLYDSTRESDCRNCPKNLILVSANHDLYVVFRALLNLAAVVVIALVIVELVKRVSRAKGREAQIYSPVRHAGGATLLAFALLFASVVVHGSQAHIFRGAAFASFLAVPYAFLVGLMRGRLSRAGAVAELVESLGHADHRRRSLRDAIAAALDDSSLSLAYWIPERRAYADPEGQPVELPAAGSGRIATPIEHAGEPLALIVHDESLAEERELVRAIGGAAALTLENERLAAELRARIAELRASRARIVEAADEERRRLERDLHDGAQQRLVALSLNLKMARKAFENDPDAARELLDDAIEELTQATAELRELARGIHPAILTDRGLDAAVGALATRASVPVEVRTVPAERLAPPVESTAYFVVAEALTNIARYAQASHAEVAIDRDDGKLVVEVRDDGVGGADPGRGSGLRGLADRVAAVDGRLTVTSAPGSGTVVHAEIPCAR
jgi:signal transduction histidine kinase